MLPAIPLVQAPLREVAPVVALKGVDDSLVARLAEGRSVRWEKLNANIFQLKALEGTFMSRKVFQQKEHLAALHLTVKPFEPFLHDGGVHPCFLIVAVSAMETRAIDVLEAARVGILTNHPQRNLQINL